MTPPELNDSKENEADKTNRSLVPPSKPSPDSNKDSQTSDKTIKKGYFNVFPNKAGEKFDIQCELHSEYAKGTIPPEQKELYLEVESTNNVIKSLQNTKDKAKEKYFNKLLSLAQAGLVGETAQPELAMASLKKLREEIILIEGQRIKNDYMKKLGILALVMCALALALYLLLQLNINTAKLSMYCIAFIGALVGTWISFGARKFAVTFDQLSLLEEDMMSPKIRLIYIGICSVIFLLFLNTKIISISVGSISTLNIYENVEVQLSVGLLCGLVESKLGLNLYKKAVGILSSEKES